MLTPQKIQDLADPIESIYISMTNELMVNIGKHITSPNWTHTAAWEIQKLSELGQLTAENAAIINGWIAQIPDEIRDTMEETRRIALEGIEQDLSKAADKGYLTPPMRDSTYDVLNEYGQQAADKLNMVNTTMLESSVQMYKRGVAMVMSEEQAAAAQGILNEETGAVVSGTETRTKALQRAIDRMNDEGITGFYDRAGRSWSAEAYVNMDIRTTVHNTAIQSVKNRMNDYGAQVFQVSAHAGARPLCYPYQGKMFSWDNTSGEIEDGNGKTWKYAPLNSTSYGQAAGLFGVNCGHSPIPIIPGVSIPHAQDYVQPKSENDKAYAESQEQRALERKIRNAKRAIEMGDDSPEAKQKVKDAQKEMRDFIDRTGRTRRYDREQLYGAKKAPAVTEEQKQQAAQPTVNKVEPPKFTPAKTTQEAEEFARQFVEKPGYKQGVVDYGGIDVEYANEFNRALNDVLSAFGPMVKVSGMKNGVMYEREEKRLLKNITPFNKREARFRNETAEAAYQWVNHNMFYNKDYFKTPKAFAKHMKDIDNAKAVVMNNLDILEKKYQNDNSTKGVYWRGYIRGLKESGRSNVGVTPYTDFVHECGHYLDDTLFSRKYKEYGINLDESYETYSFGISGYATTTKREYIAESFTAYFTGEKDKVDPALVTMFEGLRK